MDLATLIGLLGALALIVVSMLLSGDLIMFLNIPSVVIVFGGSAFAVMAKFGLGQFLSAFKVAGKSFSSKMPNPAELIDEIVELADAATDRGDASGGVEQGILARNLARDNEAFA